MNNKKIDFKPGSPVKTIINNQFLTNKRFSKWFFKTFSKLELKFFSEYYYEDLVKRTEIIWFKEWFLDWYPSEYKSFKIIVVLSAMEKRSWMKPDASVTRVLCILTRNFRSGQCILEEICYKF